jgi:carbonic anhydrase/acetyltransferase-like protein (isoleucine patch superfamily)
MDGRGFDDLNEALSRKSTSRRGFLKRLVGGTAGSLLALSGIGGGGLRAVRLSYAAGRENQTTHPTSSTTGPTFVDPTASIFNREYVSLGQLVYVAPFARLLAGSDREHGIAVGNETNIQDSVLLVAGGGPIHLGEQVIIAHGAIVKGPAYLGMEGRCPDGGAVCPSFVGFNAEVDGAVIEKDAMVSTLARVAPGVTIPSGRNVLPGKNVATIAEVAAKTVPVTEADRAFMHGVVEVNVAFARQYTKLAEDNLSNVFGINYDPGNTAFNPARDLPTLAGKRTRNPGFRNRIIGDVRLVDDQQMLDQVLRSRISLRADEGEPFVVGTIAIMDDQTTFHALEHSHLQLGARGRYGAHSLVHGGPNPEDPTTTGSNFTLGDQAVFFRSRAGSNCRIGAKSLVQQSNLPDGTVIPDHTIFLNNQIVGHVEW